MSKHLLRTAMVLGIAALAVSFTGLVHAQGMATNAPAPAPKPKPQRHQYAGLITVIDAKAGTVIVKKEGAESKTFKIGEKTKYSTADKKDAAITDIKIGDKVTVHYTEEDGVLMAHHIGPPRNAEACPVTRFASTDSVVAFRQGIHQRIPCFLFLTRRG